MGKKSKRSPKKAQQAARRREARPASASSAGHRGAADAGTLPPALARTTVPAVARPMDAANGLLTSSRAAQPARTRKVMSKLVPETQEPGRGWAALEGVEPHGLAVTYWFDAPPGEYTAAVRFTGTRAGATGKSAARDAFQRTERVTGMARPGDRVAVTTRVSGVNAGQWRVRAEPVEQAGSAETARLPQRIITTRTTFAKLAYGPAVRLTAWPALVFLGFVVALAMQGMLTAHAGVAVLPVTLVSLAASVLGYAGGKAYYLILHRKHPREFLTAGACIQGFLIVAFAVVALAVAALRLPVGTLLDATAPGLFLGMAIGRPGCFLTGCCAGRPTGSRWGICSSDRRVITRRIPVQLIETGVALAIGSAALALVLTTQPPVPGAIFVGAMAAYVLARQVLFTLRANSRTPKGRAVTMTIAGVVLAAASLTALA